MEPCNTKPPTYANQGSANVAAVYPPVMVIRANKNRVGLLLARSSIGGTIYLSSDASQNVILSLSDQQPQQLLTLENFGDLVQGEFWTYANGGGIKISWTEFLCWPC